MVLSGIKSVPENEFESLGNQKEDFYALHKKSIFHWKMYLFPMRQFEGQTFSQHKLMHFPISRVAKGHE